MRTGRFEQSHLKIQRAKEHIADVESTLIKWATADDFHAVHIHRDYHRKLVYMRIQFDELTFPSGMLALIIGDALHNLRSALDLLWYQVVLECHGEPTDWTRFPIFSAREKLVNAMKSALKQKQITFTVRDFVIDTIKPYEAGNFPLWALHRLNIRDKHELLVPLLQLVRFHSIHLQDENGALYFTDRFWITESACSFRLDREIGPLPNPWRKKFTVQQKGHATATIIFNLEVPFQAEAVIPSLHRIAEEVRRTVEAFDILL